MDLDPKWYCVFLIVAVICGALALSFYNYSFYGAKKACFAANLGDKCLDMK